MALAEHRTRDIAANGADATSNSCAEIRGEGLVETYRRRRVVNEVNISVKHGEIVGLLGPNGAGKTTTFCMLMGVVRPDGGHVFLNGRDITALPRSRFITSPRG